MTYKWPTHRREPSIGWSGHTELVEAVWNSCCQNVETDDGAAGDEVGRVTAEQIEAWACGRVGQSGDMKEGQSKGIWMDGEEKRLFCNQETPSFK